MKVIAWAELEQELVIPEGETYERMVTVEAAVGEGDLHVQFLVLFGSEDLHGVPDGDGLIPRMIARLQEQIDLLQPEATKVADLERLVTEQAMRIAELEAQANPPAAAK